MTYGFKDLKSSRILVTNDDGILSDGIAILEKIAKTLSDDVWVIAPDVEQSAKSHSITLERPLRKSKIAEKRYTINGTPTDCVIMATHDILKDKKADLVLSGVNNGLNLAEDVHYSGTVAAALEATMLGMPAIAFSLGTFPGKKSHWDTVEACLPNLIKRLTNVGWDDDVLINVNFPNIPVEELTGMSVVAQGKRKYGFSVVETTDPRKNIFHWISSYASDDSSAPDTDLTAFSENKITLTPLHVDLTHKKSIERLKTVFS